jgi:hypothetical protein
MLIHPFLLSQHNNKAVGWETEEFDLNSWQEQETFLFFRVSRPAMGSSQLPIQWILGAISPGVKGQRYESEYSPPPSAKVKNSRITPTFPCMSSWCDD